ncbi:MAG: hypothetical protein NTW29_03600 [Bacteroidetes bacterium]|nr:hypothetical protein [Bacteroidota bacterium]
MKVVAVILFLLFSTPAFAQVKKVKKVVWRNTELQAFIAASGKMKQLQFFKDDRSTFELKPDTVPLSHKQLTFGNWYSMTYLGHRYLFEQEFGMIPLAPLMKKLDSLRHADCYSSTYSGTIYADRIELTVESNCPGKSAEDMVFEKVEDNAGYLGGTAAFQQMIHDRLTCTNYRDYLSGDTALFFYAHVKKDSMCHAAKPLDGNHSLLREIVAKALTNSYGWKPYRKDGFLMSAYVRVFILLRKDGSIEADYFH